MDGVNMDFFVKELFEKDFSEMIFGKEVEKENNFIIISEEWISEDNRRISSNEIDIHTADENTAREISKLFKVNFKEDCHRHYRGTMKIPFFPISYKYKDEFAFREISISPSKLNGKYVIPKCFKFWFKDIFPHWKNDVVYEDGELAFVEYTGSYPQRCFGETIMVWKSANGECKIRSFAIKHDTSIWTVKKPYGLSFAKMPQELLDKYDNKTTCCCGGCD